MGKFFRFRLGTVAIVGATLGIVIFGEIIPQAICCRHGLMIGYKTLPLTYMFMLLTSPMAWPLGKLLDKILGNEDFINYSKARFLGLIKQVRNNSFGFYRDELDMFEINLIIGTDYACHKSNNWDRISLQSQIQIGLFIPAIVFKSDQ